MSSPDVSVVITVRGEGRARLERLLGLLEGQSFRSSEVVIAVHPEERELLRELVGRRDDFRIIDNPSGERSRGLNRALGASCGKYICRIDARSMPGPDYIERCIERLRARPDIGVVGGVQRPVPGGPGPLARGIARALGNPVVTGGANYRRGGEGPVDTVYLGAFRRNELMALGGWDIRLDVNEDYDLCQRYRRSGHLVWLEDRLIVGYEARCSLRAVWTQYFAFGVGKVRYWRLTRDRPAGRQIVALGVAGFALSTLAASATLHPRVLRRIAFIGGLAAVGADLSTRTPASVPVRASAIMTMPIVQVAWLAGIVQGVLTHPVPSPSQ